MTKKGRIQKKPYSNPKIAKVNLKSEEAVLTACKVDSQASPLGTNAGGCKWHGSNCASLGS
jgi:hypothetical protein